MGGGVLTESLAGNCLFIFYTSLVNSSFPSSSTLWGAGVKSTCYLTSHRALHGMPAVAEWQHAQCYYFEGAKLSMSPSDHLVSHWHGHSVCLHEVTKKIKSIYSFHLAKTRLLKYI